MKNSNTPMMKQQQSLPTKNDSFLVVWKRRLSLISELAFFAIFGRLQSDWNISKERFELEKMLRHRIDSSMSNQLDAESRRRLRSELKKAKISIREEEWAFEQKKDLYCVSIGMGMSSFLFSRFGYFPATNRVISFLSRKYKPRPRIDFFFSSVCSAYVAHSTYNVYYSYINYRNGYSELPLLEGKSDFMDKACYYTIKDYQNFLKEITNPEARDALNNPTTFALRSDINLYANCLRRQQLQDQLRRKKGIALDSPILPVRIPSPGVPKTGRLMNGVLVLPKNNDEDKEHDDE